MDRYWRLEERIGRMDIMVYEMAVTRMVEVLCRMYKILLKLLEETSF